MSEEKKVRFNNDVETKIIENQDNSNNSSNDNSNNSNNDNSNQQDLEQQILKSIERGNEKEREREKELKERSKIIDFKKENRYKEEVFNDRIESIDGEENYGSDDEDRIKRDESKKFKSTIKSKRAFRNDDEYSDEDIEEENESAGKRKDDDEIEIDSFNLEGEHERGFFDQSGNFIFKKEDKEQDAWLQEYDQVWASKVPKISKRELEKQDAQQTAEEEDLWEIEHQEELKKRRLGLSDSEKSFRLETLNKIYNILQNDKETVLAALKRLGGSGSGVGASKRPEIKRKNPPKNKRSTNNDSTVAAATTTTTPSIDAKQVEENKKQFNKLTELADSLLSNGYMNIYSETKLSIGSTFKKEAYTPL